MAHITRFSSLAVALPLAIAFAFLPGPGALAQSRVGVTAAVNQQADLERNRARRTIVIGEDVIFQDRVITSTSALVQVMFVDGSAFTVGANSNVVIDEFVFDPATGSGELVAEVTRGALRFVGGRLSKGNNDVRLRTPVGTLGVRGAIVEIDLDPPCLSDGRCPVATATLVFGDELVLLGDDGQRRRIYENGNTFVVFSTPTGFRTDIVPVSALELGDLQQRLSGTPGQSGGSGNIPTDEDVARSGIPDANSNRAPFLIVPRPKPQIVTTASAPDEDLVGIGETTREIDDSIIEFAERDFVSQVIAELAPPPGDDPVDPPEGEEDDPVTPPPPDPEEPTDPEEPVRGTLSGVFVTPDGFVTSSGVTITDPGETHIVEALVSAPFDVEVIEGESGVPTGVVIGDITLPFPSGEGETPIAPTASTVFDATVTGTILRGPGNFALYYLQEDAPGAAADTVLYVAVGTQTPSEVFYPGSPIRPAEYRTYTLGPDYQRVNRGIATDVPLLNPLVAQAFGNDFLEAAEETPLYVIERADLSANARLLYAAMRIEGQGGDQRSMIVSDAGDLFNTIAETNEPALGFGGSRRGSFRIVAEEEAIFMRGGTGSLPIGDPTFNTTVAGPNGEAFVYSSGTERGLFRNRSERQFLDVELADPLRAPTGPDQYSSMTVPAFLGGQSALSGLDRSSVSFSGYAAGLVENDGGSVVPFRSTRSEDVILQFDPANSTIGGIIATEDVTDQSFVDFFQYAFGFDVTGTYPEAASGRSAFLSDDVYAANSTGAGDEQGSATTLIFTENESVVRHTQADPGTYVVSYDAVPQPQFFADAGVTPCECRFMEWGWWGSQTEYDDPSLPGGQRRDFVHLGTWVTGDIPTNDELPTVGTGSFAGHVVGNVVNDLGAARAQYLAAGDLSLDYDFGVRSGTLSIDNFDGRSFSGTMTGSATPGVPNRFTGPLSGSGLTGAAAGSFVRGPGGPADGVLGAFDVDGTGYSAAGTFMGERAGPP